MNSRSMAHRRQVDLGPQALLLGVEDKGPDVPTDVEYERFGRTVRASLVDVRKFMARLAVIVTMGMAVPMFARTMNVLALLQQLVEIHGTSPG